MILDKNRKKFFYLLYDTDINELQKKGLKRNLILEIRIYMLIMTLIFLLFVLGNSFVSKASSPDIPFSFFKMQSDNYQDRLNSKYVKYSQTVDKSISSDGITITINEMLCDENTLSIDYTLKGNKKIKDFLPDKNISAPRFINPSFMINGLELNAIRDCNGYFLDEYTYICTEELDIADKNIPSNFNFDISIRDLSGIEGDWNFKFNISKDQIAKQTTTFKPYVKVDFPDCSIRINKVLFTPINTSIMFNGNYKVNGSKFIEYNNWIVFDDKGIELNSKGSSIQSTVSIFSDFMGQLDFHSLESYPKYITVIPYKYTNNTILAEQSKNLFKNTYPQELPQGKIGKIIIKEVNTNQNKTTINYTAEGVAPYFQASHLYLSDENGNSIIPANRSNIRKSLANPMEYCLEFYNLNPCKEYNLISKNLDNYEIRDDIKFKIPLTD